MKQLDNTMEWVIISDKNYYGKLYIFRFHKNGEILGRYPGISLSSKIYDIKKGNRDYDNLLNYIDQWVSAFGKETGLNRSDILNAL